MYFDPGTGSLIIQVLVAALAAAGAMVLAFKTRIKGWFSKKTHATTEIQKTDPVEKNN